MMNFLGILLLSFMPFFIVAAEPGQIEQNIQKFPIGPVDQVERNAPHIDVSNERQKRNIGLNFKGLNLPLEMALSDFRHVLQSDISNSNLDSSDTERGQNNERNFERISPKDVGQNFFKLEDNSDDDIDVRQLLNMNRRDGLKVLRLRKRLPAINHRPGFQNIGRSTTDNLKRVQPSRRDGLKVLRLRRGDPQSELSKEVAPSDDEPEQKRFLNDNFNLGQGRSESLKLVRLRKIPRCSNEEDLFNSEPETVHKI